MFEKVFMEDDKETLIKLRKQKTILDQARYQPVHIRKKLEAVR